jgi:hypothetical protein
VTYADLQAVLNFMYHGEVSVAQDSLNSFLAVAEELHVKGLTQNNSGSSANGAGNSGAEWGDGDKNTARTASGGGHRNSSSGNNSVVGTSSVTAIASKKHDLPHRVNNSNALSGGGSLTRSAPRDLEEPSAKRSKPGGGLPLTSSTMALPFSLQKHRAKEEEEEEDDIQEVLPVKQEPVSAGQDMGLPPTPSSQQHRSYDAKVNYCFRYSVSVYRYLFIYL